MAKCPVKGCQWTDDDPMPGFSKRDYLLYHLSAVARDCIRPGDEHERLLYELKGDGKSSPSGK